MLSDETLKSIDLYWSSYLGCGEHDLCSTTPFVCKHSKALEDYVGIYIFIKGDAIVISTPQGLVKQIAGIAQSWTVEHLLSQEFLKNELSFLNPKKFIGTAYIGYCEEANQITNPNVAVRILNQYDLKLIDTFRTKIEPLDWEYGGSDVTKDRVIGVFTNDELVVVAGYRILGNKVAHIAIVTSSNYRSGGYAKLAVSSIAHDALENNLIPQYQTLMSNQSSMRVARALNFSHYATSISIRL